MNAQRAVDQACDYYRAGWWRSKLPTDDLRHHATETPNRKALVSYSVDGGWTEELSFYDLQTVVDQIASGLIELGVKPGDVVAFQLPNWWHFPAINLACIRIGAIACPIVPILRRREVEFILRTVRSRVFISPEVFRGFDHKSMGLSLRSSVPSLDAVFTIAGGDESRSSFGEFFLSRTVDDRARSLLDGLRPSAEMPATIKFTSGTTGVPKGVVHSHNTLFATTRLVPHMLKLDQSDVVMMPSPLGHASGYLYGFLMPIIWGMKAVYQDIWEPARMLNLTKREGGTWSIGSPPFLVDLMRACESGDTSAAPLQNFTCAGAPIPRYLARDLPRTTGARMSAIWGMTETGAVSATPLDRLDSAHQDDGAISPVMEAKIVDAAGVEVPTGVSGRLLVRGASKFLGYFERPDLDNDVIDGDGWLDTGDVAAINRDRHLMLTGRVKDILIRGGENVPLVEVEAALMQHRAVREVAVIALPDPRLGERACAVVVPEEGHEITLSDLTVHLENLGFAKHYWPEVVETVPSLPRTAAGKIQKFALLEGHISRGQE